MWTLTKAQGEARVRVVVMPMNLVNRIARRMAQPRPIGPARMASAHPQPPRPMPCPSYPVLVLMAGAGVSVSVYAGRGTTVNTSTII